MSNRKCFDCGSEYFDETGAELLDRVEQLEARNAKLERAVAALKAIEKEKADGLDSGMHLDYELEDALAALDADEPLEYPGIAKAIASGPIEPGDWVVLDTPAPDGTPRVKRRALDADDDKT